MSMQYADKDAWNDLRRVQDEITRWATEQFPHRTDHHAIYKLVVEEIPELAVHKKEKGTEEIGLELADCFILLLDLASLWEVDVASAIAEKMGINYNREWKQDSNGIMQHIEHEGALDDPIPRPAEGMIVTGIRCPKCQSQQVVGAPITSIYLYQCLACNHEFDDDIPF